MTFKVVKYYEAYSEYQVEADSQSAAEDMVLSGEVDPDETTVKESEIISCDLV